MPAEKSSFLYTTEMFRNMYKRNKKKRGVHAHVYIGGKKRNDKKKKNPFAVSSM